jgi:hypothetical protein
MITHKNVDLVAQMATLSCLHQLRVVIVPTTANFQVAALEILATFWMPLRTRKRGIALVVSVTLLFTVTFG